MAKGPEAFRTISEAAEELGVAQHVLRFWETKFPFIKPMKRAGGRRFYRPGDIALLATVRGLLRQEGYSIRGVQKLHREGGFKAPAGPLPAPSGAQATSAPNSFPRLADPQARVRLEAALSSLLAAKTRLDGVLNSDAPA